MELFFGMKATGEKAGAHSIMNLDAYKGMSADKCNERIYGEIGDRTGVIE